MAKEMHAIPSLDTYRTESSDAPPESQTYSVTRAPLVNRVSQDITSSGRPVFEFDCEQMSLTLGLAMQKVEQNMLPAPLSEKDLHGAQNYYYAIGKSHTIPDSSEVPAAGSSESKSRVEGHAMIVSSATGHFMKPPRTNPTASTPATKRLRHRVTTLQPSCVRAQP